MLEIKNTVTEVKNAFDGLISILSTAEERICELEQGSPTPRPRTGTGPWLVKNQATQQEVSGGRVSEASSDLPHRSPSLTLPPETSPPHPPTPLHGKTVFHKTGP